MISERLGVFGTVASIIVAYGAALEPARGANDILPGAYSQVSPSTKRIMGVGNEIVIARDRHGRLAFSLNAIRRSDENLGYIAGTLAHLSRKIVWTNTVQDARCRLTFVSLADDMLRVMQDARFGDCGFGYGVLADGVYKRTKPTGRPGSWNGP